MCLFYSLWLVYFSWCRICVLAVEDDLGFSIMFYTFIAILYCANTHAFHIKHDRFEF